MNRLLALPLITLTACTMTITTPPEHPAGHGTRVTHKASRIIPAPSPGPSIPEVVHEDYKPLYDKMRDKPQPPTPAP